MSTITRPAGQTEAPIDTRSQPSGGSMTQSLAGLAVLLLVLGHFTDRIPPVYFGSQENYLLVCYFGKIGIFLGFVLVGAHIPLLLARTRDLGSFLAERIARLWLLHAVVDVVVFAWIQLLPPPVIPTGPKSFFDVAPSLIDVPAAMFFLKDLGFTMVDGGHWPLIVVIKYIVLAGVLALLPRFRPAQTVALLATLIGSAALLLELVDFGVFGLVAKALNGLLVAEYLPFFALGAVIADRRLGLWIAPLSILCAGVVAVNLARLADFNLEAAVLFCAVLTLAYLCDLLIARGTVARLLGRYAYAWFLVHQIVGLSMIRYLAGPLSLNGAVVAALIGTFGLSVLLSWAVEWRFQPTIYRVLLACARAVGLTRLRFRAEISEQAAADDPLHRS